MVHLALSLWSSSLVLAHKSFSHTHTHLEGLVRALNLSLSNSSKMGPRNDFFPIFYILYIAYY